MIKNYDGEKATPKTKAQDIIYRAISQTVDYWAESDSDGMTEKEKQKVEEQIKKECNRIVKRMGFDPEF